MAELKVVLGNKNYSSWSLRPWLAMRHAGIAFEEEIIPLDMDDHGGGTDPRILAHSPAGKVPILFHDGRRVWDSLSILEYVAELFPKANLWPADQAARAMARSASAEMHSSFQPLRAALPMNLRRKKNAVALEDDAQRNVDRIVEIWREARAEHGAGGSFLFGGFSIADAMYAPVVTRFDTYAVPVDDDTRAYMETILALPAFLEWKQAAEAEPWVIESEEI